MSTPTWFWVAAGMAALVVGVMSDVASTPRLTFVLLIVALVAVLPFDRNTTVLIAIALIPTIAFFRRISSGPQAYILNDPLSLLPLLLIILAVVRYPASGEKFRYRELVLALIVWQAISGGYSLASGGGISSVFGVVTAVAPMVLAVRMVDSMLDRSVDKILYVVAIIGAPVSVYSVWQRFYPAPWDLKWLTTQQDELVSVGRPIAGQFRVWGTAESPGSLAAFLGVAALCCLLLVFSRPQVWRSLQGLALLLGATLAFVALAFTAVRGALFALPLAISFGVLVSSRVFRLSSLLVVASAAGASLILPAWLSDAASAGRYSLGQLSEDQSFKDRSSLLSEFSANAFNSFFGSGPGTSGVAGRLSSGQAQQNIDNGFLSRLIETGLVGLLVFIAVILVALLVHFRSVRRGVIDPHGAVWSAIIVYFVLLDFSGPNTGSLLGFFLWIGIVRNLLLVESKNCHIPDRSDFLK